MSEHVEEAVVDEVEEDVLAPGIHVEQHSPTRVTFHILKEVWDGLAEVGRVEEAQLCPLRELNGR